MYSVLLQVSLMARTTLCWLTGLQRSKRHWDSDSRGLRLAESMQATVFLLLYVPLVNSSCRLVLNRLATKVPHVLTMADSAKSLKKGINYATSNLGVLLAVPAAAIAMVGRSMQPLRSAACGMMALGPGKGRAVIECSTLGVFLASYKQLGTGAHPLLARQHLQLSSTPSGPPAFS